MSVLLPRAVLLAGGEGRRMGRLAAGRPKPLVPYGGVSRLIDFSIANARTSGLGEVLLLSQYEERQLMDDLHAAWNGAPDFRVHFGPYDEAYRAARPGQAPPLPTRTWPLERGTADALIAKAPYVFGGGERRATQILVLHADHVYHFDYRSMLAQHVGSGAALTMAYQRIDPRYVPLFGEVAFDSRGRLTAFTEKPEHPVGDLVFAAFCVFDAAVLHRCLERLDGTDWQHDISRDVIPALLNEGALIRGYPVRGHWEDIGTVQRYHRSSLALLEPEPGLAWDLMPRTVQPALDRHLTGIQPGLVRSLVPADLRNEGLLDHCVVFPGAAVGPGAEVRRSVLMSGVTVPADARIEDAIVHEDGFVEPVEAAP